MSSLLDDNEGELNFRVLLNTQVQSNLDKWEKEDQESSNLLDFKTNVGKFSFNKSLQEESNELAKSGNNYKKTKGKMKKRSERKSKKSKSQQISSITGLMADKHREKGTKQQKISFLKLLSGKKRKVNDILSKIEEIEKEKSSETDEGNAKMVYTKDEWFDLMKTIRINFPGLSRKSKLTLSKVNRLYDEQYDSQYQNTPTEEDSTSLWKVASSVPKTKLTDDDLRWLYDLEPEDSFSVMSQASVNSLDLSQRPYEAYTLSQILKDGLGDKNEALPEKNNSVNSVISFSKPKTEAPEIVNIDEHINQIPVNSGSIVTPVTSPTQIPSSSPRASPILILDEDHSRLEPIELLDTPEKSLTMVRCTDTVLESSKALKRRSTVVDSTASRNTVHNSLTQTWKNTSPYSTQNVFDQPQSVHWENPEVNQLININLKSNIEPNVASSPFYLTARSNLSEKSDKKRKLDIHVIPDSASEDEYSIRFLEIEDQIKKRKFSDGDISEVQVLSSQLNDEDVKANDVAGTAIIIDSNARETGSSCTNDYGSYRKKSESIACDSTSSLESILKKMTLAILKQIVDHWGFSGRMSKREMVVLIVEVYSLMADDHPSNIIEINLEKKEIQTQKEKIYNTLNSYSSETVQRLLVDKINDIVKKNEIIFDKILTYEPLNLTEVADHLRKHKLPLDEETIRNWAIKTGITYSLSKYARLKE